MRVPPVILIRTYTAPNGKSITVTHRTQRDVYSDTKAIRCVITAALKAGVIERPSHCEECGVKPRRPGLIHGHHDDYNKPLDLVWLCTRCHGKRRSVRHRLPENLEEWIRRVAYPQRLTLKQIASEWNCSIPAARKTLTRMGAQLPRKRRAQ